MIAGGPGVSHGPPPPASPASPPGLVNVANVLTIARLALVPVFVILLVKAGHPGARAGDWRPSRHSRSPR